ncbi:MAG: hypothetical protein WCI55_09025 [Armatimonadota bacterium]
MSEQATTTFLMLAGAVVALAVFVRLVCLAKAKKGISMIEIICLLAVCLGAMFVIAGQVRFVTSFSSGPADDK